MGNKRFGPQESLTGKSQGQLATGSAPSQRHSPTWRVLGLIPRSPSHFPGCFRGASWNLLRPLR